MYTLPRLLLGTDPVKPEKEVLKKALTKEISKLPLSPKEVARILTAFDISFFGHEFAPLRASGEAYIYHVLMVSFLCIRVMVKLAICDAKLIVILLLHDCFEDAKDGGHSVELLFSYVVHNLEIETAHDVYCMTKDKEKGSDHYWEKQLLGQGRWRPIGGKFFDRLHNVRTFRDMSVERRERTLAETEYWSPQLYEKLVILIGREVSSKRLPRAWQAFPHLIYKILKDAVRKERRRLHK